MSDCGQRGFVSRKEKIRVDLVVAGQYATFAASVQLGESNRGVKRGSDRIKSRLTAYAKQDVKGGGRVTRTRKRLAVY
jgi:hypothetical protein